MRIKWLDGLKGFACFAVLWHHFILAFFPGQFTGQMGKTAFFNPVENPLTFVVNGNFMVTLFMVASGMAAALSIMNMGEKSKLGAAFSKRYFRLMLPVIPVALVVYLFSARGWFYSTATSLYTNSNYMAQWYNSPIDLFTALKSAVFSSWYTTDTTISGVFWVFPYFLWGYFLAAILSVMSWRKEKSCLILYVIFTVLIGFANCYYMAFSIGVLIVYIFKNYRFLSGDSILHRLFSVVLFVAGFLLGGYPSAVAPTNYYRLLPDLSPFGITNCIFWHVIGSGLVIAGLWNLRWMKAFFESKLFQTLGSISYEVFLVHMIVLCSLSCTVFRILLSLVANYNLSVLLTFIVTNLAVFLVAFCYHKLLSVIK